VIPRSIRRAGIWGWLLGGVLAGQLAVSGTVFAETEESAQDTSHKLAYDVKIEGVGDGKLYDVLKATSQTVAFADRPPATELGLQVRADGDVERLNTALRSEGYYDASVSYRLNTSVSPAQVVFQIDPGPPYYLESYEIKYTRPAEHKGLPKDIRRLGLHIGMPARAPDIVAAESTLMTLLMQRGYPHPIVDNRQATVDHADHSMRVVVNVDQGPYAVFGPVSYEGLEDVDETLPRSLLTWKKGEPFDQREIEKYRKDLWQTELFKAITFDKSHEVGADGSLPITVKVVEALPRTVGAGANYSTDEGFGIEVFWRHRNLFGEGERLETRIELAQIRQSLKATFRKPVFLRKDQSFLAATEFTREDTDAFRGLTGTASVGVERKIDEGFTVSAGLSLDYSSLEDAGKNSDVDTYYLVGVPLVASLDRTNNALNPERGFKASAQATPYYGTGNKELTFLSASLSGAVYVPIDSDRRYVWAGRAKVGTIIGAETQDIPANLRLYAGGGGSVRGYAYQSVGPLDNAGDPLGGRSLIEAAMEVRVKVTDTIAVVPFIDGGNVYDASWPDLGQGLLWAGGLGVRYYTDFGPLRFDVATPINGRPSDDNFQFYVSLGQAF
jgi:translocation and assembly module TamA